MKNQKLSKAHIVNQFTNQSGTSPLVTLLAVAAVAAISFFGYKYYTEERVELLTEANPYVGVFIANMPAASSPGRRITLETSADQTATFTQDYQNDEEPIVETGIWGASEENHILVTLDKRGDEMLEQPVVMSFEYNTINGGVLTLNDQNEEWGTAGLTLQNIVPLINSEWVWQETILSDDTRTETDENYSFRLVFSQDGRVSAATDCNNGMGSYEVNGETGLIFGPMATTLMYCEGSMETVFLGQLSQTGSYMLEDGNLNLLLRVDSGTMVFTPEIL